MSDALTYLLKTRPGPMGHYFKFLKEAGGSLDPKTRGLISVITKVHAQTARGVKQYVKRALADGATANEVLDALLMAFPALGLAKIVWAVDVLLEMDLPEFRIDTLVAEPAWHPLGKALSFALQREQNGTGHAVGCAASALSGFQGSVLILSGDVPLITRQTLGRLIDAHRSSPGPLALLRFRPSDPTGYGRLVANDSRTVTQQPMPYGATWPSDTIPTRP